MCQIWGGATEGGVYTPTPPPESAPAPSLLSRWDGKVYALGWQVAGSNGASWMDKVHRFPQLARVTYCLTWWSLFSRSCDSHCHTNGQLWHQHKMAYATQYMHRWPFPPIHSSCSLYTQVMLRLLGGWTHLESQVNAGWSELAQCSIHHHLSGAGLALAFVRN